MDHFGLIPDNEPTISPTPSSGCNPNWTLGRVKLLMASYRLTDYQNPDGFLATLCSILEEYPPEIVEYVTDPKTGLQRRCKWPPTPAEIVEACAAEIGWRGDSQEFDLGSASETAPPRFSAEDSYERMFAKYGRPTGVFERSGDEWSRRHLPKQEAAG